MASAAGELWLTEYWGVIEPDGSGAWRTIENGHYVEQFPADAVPLVAVPDLEALHERDQAGQEVARIWHEILLNPSLVRDMGLPPAFRAALDALTLAHEDGGRDL
jgi:hypothetical protein